MSFYCLMERLFRGYEVAPFLDGFEELSQVRKLCLVELIQFIGECGALLLLLAYEVVSQYVSMAELLDQRRAVAEDGSDGADNALEGLELQLCVVDLFHVLEAQRRRLYRADPRVTV